MYEILLLTLLTWLTYWGALKNGFVSDDIQAIAEYDGKFCGWDYGRLTKFIFYRLFQKDPRRNHIFPIILHNANAILLFLLLRLLFPNGVAFFTSVLFVVHPVNTQAIAWISARGYPIGLFWMLLVLNIVVLNNPFTWLAVTNLPLFCLLFVAICLLYFLGIHAQFATMMTFVIFLLTGNYFLALIGLCISAVMGADIIKEVIGLRTKVFKEQNMGDCTKLHHRRFVVAVKSLWYYIKLCVFPKRMGLYHTYGYHLNEKLLREDRQFWIGFAVLGLMIFMIIQGIFLVKFALVWFLAYIFIFMNWITIHQFVSERYCYIPNIGICLILAHILTPFPIVFWFITALYLMRTWVHLPSYEDEVPFYQSNIWNFPSSEVAFANLGVTYMKRGLTGSAMDMWLIALKINKDYDVAYYNISSTLKSRGDFVNAHKNLKAAVNCKTCHFKDKWMEELKDLEHEMDYIKYATTLRNNITELFKDPAKRLQAEALKVKMEKLQKFHIELDKKRKQEVVLLQQQEKSLKEKIIQLEKHKEVVEKPIEPKRLVAIRDSETKKIGDEFKKIVGVVNANTSAGVCKDGQPGNINPSNITDIQAVKHPRDKKE